MYLSLSHDEVVYGKQSLIGKMPGDEGSRRRICVPILAICTRSRVRNSTSWGAEFGQTAEWNHDDQLQWFLTAFDRYRGIQSLVRDLNHLYKNEATFTWRDCEPSGFEWRLQDAADISVIAPRAYQW